MIDDLSIEQLIDALAKKAKPKYILSMREFVPGKTIIPYSGPWFDEREIAAAIKSIATGKWISNGESTFRFQTAFAKQFNVKHSQMVNSGSSANLMLITALKKRLGWKDGDEVIVSPVGFPTTIAPIVQNNLKPVFVDIEMDTLNFNVDLIPGKITDRTRAIFVSPVLGNPPNMDKLLNLVGWRGLMPSPGIKLIGDNCDSLGTKWNGAQLSDSYLAWTTSFYVAHHLSTMEGGMVSSNDEELMKLVRSFSWWGRACYCVGQANLLSCGTCGIRFSKHLADVDAIVDHKYVFENMGYNLKPLDLQGAIGLAQMEKWAEIEAKRRLHKIKLEQLLNEYVPQVKVANKLDAADPCWFGVPIICDTHAIKEKLVAHLEANKIQTRNYFAGNLLRHPGYKHLDDANKYPNADKALTHVFFIGCPPFYTEAVFQYIKEVLQKWKS
ncbi:MAG: DegT/DnrJ/EryC1/StrS family aminotransferase [Candidatus Dormibacteria bacterium]